MTDIDQNSHINGNYSSNRLGFRSPILVKYLNNQLK